MSGANCFAMGKSLPITAVRLRERMEELGETQDDLAQSVGATQGAISQILTGRSQNSRLLPKIAESLAVNLNWLIGATDAKIDLFDSEGNRIREDQLAAMIAGTIPVDLVKPGQLRRVAKVANDPDTDEVEIDFIDLSYGMGGTFLDVGDAEVEKVKLPRTLLRRITPTSPESLGAAEGVGDSMEPVIFDRDLVFFDRSARLEEHISDKMWVFAYGQIGMIKRLRPLPDGTVKLMSANRTYPDEIATGDELHIIGRVVGTLRRH